MVFGLETSLTRAKASFLKSSLSPSTGGEWMTDPDMKQLRTMVGRSFAGVGKVPGEPTFGWMFSDFKVPMTEETRIAVTTMITSIVLFEDRAKGGVVFAKQSTDGNLAAAVSVVEYNAHSPYRPLVKMIDKVREFCVFASFAMRGEMPNWFFDKEYRVDAENFRANGDSLVANMDKWHKQYGPEKLHWYVHVVAADPLQQGKGVGKELLNRVGELADEEEMDCYLEAGSEKNQRFYEKCGYHLVRKTPLENKSNPDNPGTIYLMLRPAANKQQA